MAEVPPCLPLLLSTIFSLVRAEVAAWTVRNRMSSLEEAPVFQRSINSVSFDLLVSIKIDNEVEAELNVRAKSLACLRLVIL